MSVCMWIVCCTLSTCAVPAAVLRGASCVLSKRRQWQVRWDYSTLMKKGLGFHFNSGERAYSYHCRLVILLTVHMLKVRYCSIHASFTHQSVHLSIHLFYHLYNKIIIFSSSKKLAMVLASFE